MMSSKVLATLLHPIKIAGTMENMLLKSRAPFLWSKGQRGWFRDRFIHSFTHSTNTPQCLHRAGAPGTTLWAQRLAEVAGTAWEGRFSAQEHSQGIGPCRGKAPY